MIGLIISIHVIVCALLIIIILIQRGRGGGLVESFSGVESMFGTKTNTFLSRTTTILSILFFFTCLSLAFLSAQKARSLMRDIKIQRQPTQDATIQEEKPPESESIATGQTQQELPQQETPVQGIPTQEAPKTE